MAGKTGDSRFLFELLHKPVLEIMVQSCRSTGTSTICCIATTVLQQQYVAASEEEYANDDDDDDQMDSWSEGTSPLPCDASHTSDEALPIKQFVRPIWQTRAATPTPEVLPLQTSRPSQSKVKPYSHCIHN